MRKVINIIFIMALLALILGMLLAIGSNTNAQERRRPSGGIDISLSSEDVPRLFEIIRIWKIVEELELDDKQLQKFLPRFNELNDLRGEYYSKRRETSSEMKKLLEADVPESKLKSALDKYRNMKVEFHQKERQLEDVLNSDLSIKQQIKFISFEYEYRRDMSRLMRNLRELSEMKEQQKPPQPLPVQQKKD